MPFVCNGKGSDGNLKYICTYFLPKKVHKLDKNTCINSQNIIKYQHKKVKGEKKMRAVASGFSKWVLSYVAVIFVIMIMPVFLITSDVSTLDNLVNYIFGNKQ